MTPETGHRYVNLSRVRAPGHDTSQNRTSVNDNSRESGHQYRIQSDAGHQYINQLEVGHGCMAPVESVHRYVTTLRGRIQAHDISQRWTPVRNTSQSTIPAYVAIQRQDMSAWHQPKTVPVGGRTTTAGTDSWPASIHKSYTLTATVLNEVVASYQIGLSRCIGIYYNCAGMLSCSRLFMLKFHP